MKTCKRNHQYDESKRQCPECIRENQRKYYKSDRRKELKKQYYQKNKESARAYAQANAEKIKERAKRWYDENKEHHRSQNQEWRRLHKDDPAYRASCNASENKRRAAKLKATPPWLTAEHWKEIENFYIEAQELAWLNQDGKRFHVDHIVPLQAENMCGLHVPWNLQLLTESENCKKQNKVG